MTGAGETYGSRRGSQLTGPSLQVIVLGSGGGPDEDNVTGFLVRSTATCWSKGSVLAVDAGTHLAAIAKVIDNSSSHASRGNGKDKVQARGQKSGSVKNGPKSSSRSMSKTARSPHVQPKEHDSAIDNEPTLFEGLDFPCETAIANAAFVTRELVSTYLITHPHLDHISGFVINTASFQHTSRPKRLAALPSTIDAIKTHIFNDVIWPNLSDEDGGVGLVSFMRLADGGNVALGEGEGRGYIEVCEGLAVRSWSISHGHCMKQHSHRGSGDGTLADLSTQRAGTPSMRVWTPTPDPGKSRSACVYDSTAYFIRDDSSGREVLIFGDVEPDSISLSPRTAHVWAEAAPKISAGLLTGILIECSYDDSQSDETLFGHLSPRHLIAELKVLAEKVRSELSTTKEASATPRKRRRESGIGETKSLSVSAARRRASQGRTSRATRSTPLSRNSPEMNTPVGSPKDSDMADMTDPLDPQSSSDPSPRGRTSSTSFPHQLQAMHHDDPPLKGLRVIIIHAKNGLSDGVTVGERILAQLEEYDRTAGLGCEFVLPTVGSSIWL